MLESAYKWIVILQYMFFFFLFTKISDFGLIHWEESTSKTFFMENLIARGNISYISPETFTQCSDPPGCAYDVYRCHIHCFHFISFSIQFKVTEAPDTIVSKCLSLVYIVGCLLISNALYL